MIRTLPAKRNLRPSYDISKKGTFRGLGGQYGLSGFGYELLGVDIGALFNQASDTAANLLRVQAQAKLQRTITEQTQAETGLTKAQGLVQSIEANSRTIGILAALAGLGVIGYLLVSRKRRAKRG